MKDERFGHVRNCGRIVGHNLARIIFIPQSRDFYNLVGMDALFRFSIYMIDSVSCHYILNVSNRSMGLEWEPFERLSQHHHGLPNETLR